MDETVGLKVVWLVSVKISSATLAPQRIDLLQEGLKATRRLRMLLLKGLIGS